MRIKNLFENVPGHCEAELFETLLEEEGIRIEKIISEGQSTPLGEWLDQDGDEWVILLEGSAGLRFKGELLALTMKPGDYVHIPAHAPHRVEWTDPGRKTLWLAVHFACAIH